MNAEVRPGYKQTEVGIIPQDWEVKRLRDISPSQTVGLVINPSSYFEEAGTIPMLVGSHVSENSISWQTANKITEKSNNQISASRLYANDLVMVRVGEPGVTAVVPPELDGCNCASMMIIRQGRAFDSTWLCYVMNSDIGRKQVENVQYGTAQKQFNISDAVNFVYPIPPFAEQKAIASTLSGVESVITSLDQLIAKKRDIQQAAMQQLLTGQRRLPGFSEEWEMKRLGDVGELISGGTPKTSNPEYWGGNIKWCTPTDITRSKGKYLSETERNISEAGLADSGARLLPAGSLLICTRATIGELKIARTPLCTNQGFKSLICHDDISQEFMYYKLLTMKKDMIERAFGSTFLEISKANISAITFSVPPQAEQKAIATILSDMDTELAALEARRDKARHIKQGMMQELLTGRTRLI
ncbi:restriction endonuclease subunit S [Pseudomonas sp. UBA7530]|uniref:restriction endonuclease subunit S n=1 Tax=Pseudomonas sp. UBA7530 TaxID=1947341 RepID=UPI0025F33497|nr:restriction endonuclease subunit S [Pseudomonas sp. UBA7530]